MGKYGDDIWVFHERGDCSISPSDGRNNDACYCEDIEANRSEFLTSQAMAKWMPLVHRYCMFCDKWRVPYMTYHGRQARRKNKPKDVEQEICEQCYIDRETHYHCKHSNECPDRDDGFFTCGRYSMWDDGEERPGFIDPFAEPNDNEDEDVDEDEDEE